MSTPDRAVFDRIPQQRRNGESRKAVPGAAARSPVDLEVVIPAFNEYRRLPTTLEATVGFLSAQPWSSRVVVIDNGSWDDTAGVVGRFRPGAVDIVVVGCSEPGKGAAVRRGVLTSTARYVGFTDADLSTPPATLTAAMAALDGGAAAVIASRRVPGSRLAVAQPLVRRAGGSVFRSLARTVLPGVRDTQCGFKFFPRHVAAAALARCRSTGFAFDVELLAHILGDGGRIVELPVVWSNDRRSTLRPLRDGVPAVLTVARLGLATPRRVPGPPAAR